MAGRLKAWWGGGWRGLWDERKAEDEKENVFFKQRPDDSFPHTHLPPIKLPYVEVSAQEIHSIECPYLAYLFFAPHTLSLSLYFAVLFSPHPSLRDESLINFDTSA